MTLKVGRELLGPLLSIYKGRMMQLLLTRSVSPCRNDTLEFASLSVPRWRTDCLCCQTTQICQCQGPQTRESYQSVLVLCVLLILSRLAVPQTSVREDRIESHGLGCGQ